MGPGGQANRCNRRYIVHIHGQVRHVDAVFTDAAVLPAGRAASVGATARDLLGGLFGMNLVANRPDGYQYDDEQ